MWKSRDATTWTYPPDSRYWLMTRATSAPPATASEPPSQKSFCTSTITSARTARAYGIGRQGRGNARLAMAPSGCEPLPRGALVGQRPGRAEQEFGVVVRRLARVGQVAVRGQ